MDGERKMADCAECLQLRKAVAELRELVRSQSQRIESQSQQIASLQSPLDVQRRAGKRQAGPFSKGPPKADPKPPGRQSGEAYGQHQRRAIPDKIDETYDVPLPPGQSHVGSAYWSNDCNRMIFVKRGKWFCRETTKERCDGGGLGV